MGSYSSTTKYVSIGTIANLLNSILTILLTCPNNDTVLCYSNDSFLTVQSRILYILYFYHSINDEAVGTISDNQATIDLEVDAQADVFLDDPGYVVVIILTGLLLQVHNHTISIPALPPIKSLTSLSGQVIPQFQLQCS